MTIEKIELSSIKTDYESYRIKCKIDEQKLLVSIAEQGIQEPLEGVSEKDGSYLLLNGFKRYRCAKKLNIGIVPYSSLGSSEIDSIAKMIRVSNSKNLGFLEQAKLMDNLKNIHKMSVSEIAVALKMSRGWVGMRLGVVKEMSKKISDEIFKGTFPLYSYLYTVRPFMRMNGIPKKEIETFVLAVSGKDLSVRDIEILFRTYFKGSREFQEQIKEGNIKWTLEQLKNSFPVKHNYSEIEQIIINDLESVYKCIKKIIYQNQKEKLELSPSFNSQVDFWSDKILQEINVFIDILKRFKC